MRLDDKGISIALVATHARYHAMMCIIEYHDNAYIVPGYGPYLHWCVIMCSLIIL